uniref:hypothetical protein n=1 Tax=Streptomyces chartreusis TaxID=1969 RepID=UPI003F49A0EC
MTPDPRDRRRTSRRAPAKPQVRIRPSSDDAHEVVYFQRHPDDDPSQTAPGRVFLQDVCPVKVRATMRAVLAEVAAAPPKRFAGGGYWEAMKGKMGGWYEVRVNGPGRRHYRLFCLLDYEAEGATKPLLVVIAGLDKPFRTVLSDSDYQSVRKLGEEYLGRNPRSTQ